MATENPQIGSLFIVGSFSFFNNEALFHPHDGKKAIFRLFFEFACDVLKKAR